MARRKSPPKRKRKMKATSILAMCVTVGFFLGIGLGALMGAVLLVTVLAMALGAAVGYYFDKKNGISYTKRRSR